MPNNARTITIILFELKGLYGKLKEGKVIYVREIPLKNSNHGGVILFENDLKDV